MHFPHATGAPIESRPYPNHGGGGDTTHDYDYVIVGAGTAGSVIAARLSENPRVRVLLIEAGARAALPEMAVPGIWPVLLETSASWGESTVVQSFSGSAIPAPRGRALGGSSSINGMNFTRGHRSSYDAWVDQGATGWGFDDLLPYFRRSETAAGRDAEFRGTDGPLIVGPTVDPSPVIPALLQAAAEIGFPLVDDPNSGVEVGFGLSDVNVKDGQRQSAADAYLRPALSRDNLDVLTEAEVRRLIITDGVCTGVEYAHRSRLTSVTANREVILTAGAIGSAQLLLLSGVGPAEHLTELGIDVELDLPGVGSNLHEHPMSTIVYELATEIPGNPSIVGGQGIGLVDTGITGAGPDLQVLLISQPYRAQTLAGPDHDTGYAIGFSAMLPFSRGSVRLANANPTTAPLIDPNYLADPRDQQVMIEGYRTAWRIGGATAMSGWRGAQAQPGRILADDEAIIEYLRESLVVYFHYAGTCRVGTDDLAVVDPDLRVRGIAHLRVADASIMPSPISANTNATVYAIAERAAELIAEGRPR